MSIRFNQPTCSRSFSKSVNIIIIINFIKIIFVLDSFIFILVKMLRAKTAYCDLNIPFGSNCREICEAAAELGYEIIAINTPVVAKNCLPQAQGKKVGKKRKLEERTGGAMSAAAAATQQSVGALSPPQIPQWIDAIKSTHPNLRILQRLTIIFSDIIDLQGVLSQSSAKGFDLIAVVPTNHDALVACIISTNLIFDIISFDFEGPHWINKIRLNRQKGKVAAEKEVHFEITYAPSFHGDEPCENMIFMANRLTEDICTRRIKNIIIASGASKTSELRSPKDVIGLGYLLGLDETTSRNCIREHAQRCVTKGDFRKYGRTWVAFIPKSEDKNRCDNVSILPASEDEGSSAIQNQSPSPAPTIQETTLHKKTKRTKKINIMK